MTGTPPPPPPDDVLLPLRLRPWQAWLVRAVGSLGAGYVVGPLVAGMVWCSDCVSLPVRLFIGVVHVFLSVFTFGFPPRNEAGVGPPRNAWPYIGAVALTVFVLSRLLTAWARRRNRAGR